MAIIITSYTLLAVVATVAILARAECFNTRVWSTPSEVRFSPDDCQVWTRNMRTVWSSTLTTDHAEIVMHDAYTNRDGQQFVERFSLDDGHFVDAIQLEAPSLNMGASPSMCQTNYDLFIYNGVGRIDHYDLLSGKRRTSTQYDALVDSDRVSLACTGRRVFVSVPAMQAVWELLPADGLLTHVVARIPSPGAMLIHENVLYVVSGRPAVAIYAFNLADNTAATVLPATGGPVNVRGIVVQADGTVLSLSDERVTQVLATRTGTTPVTTDTLRYAPLLHQLISPTMGVRNGVVVDIHSGAATTPAASNLTNQGNVASLSWTPVVLYNDSSLVMLDTTGELAHFAVTDVCEIDFRGYLPPMQASGGLRVLAVSHPETALLYHDQDSGTTWFRATLDADEPDLRLETHVSNPTLGIVCSEPVPRACVVGAGERTIHCYDVHSPHSHASIELPDDAGEVHWDTERTGLVTFVVGADQVALWHVNVTHKTWRQACVLDEPPVDVGLDLLHWRTRQVERDAYLVQWALGVELLVDSNCTIIHRYDNNPPGTHTTLAWIDGRPLTDAVCVPINATWPVVPRHRNGAIEQAFSVWLNVGVVLLVVGCCTCCLFCAAISCRTGWYVLCCHRTKNLNAWQQMDRERKVGICGMLFCNRTVEALVYSFCTCCPDFGDRIVTRMQRTYSPRVYSASELEAGAPVSAENNGEESDDTHWREVALDDDADAPGTRAADAAK